MKQQRIRVSYDNPQDEDLFRWAAKHVDPEAKRRNDERVRVNGTSGCSQSMPLPEPLESLRAFFVKRGKSQR